jgi:predicted dithiol-disulfide oxidoreductase (DUF899 family)
MHHNRIVTQDQWLNARKQQLIREKEFTRLRDELSRQRRELPWVKVDKLYVFDGPHGKEALADLFDGRSQLIVNHFMLGPGWKQGCVGCSFVADQVEGALIHLRHHDVSYVAISRAPQAEIQAFKKRMGWGFKWVSSFGSDFNYDFHVSFTKEEIASGKVFYNYEMCDFVSEDLHGASVFHKDQKGEIFHTYSQYARGCEMMLPAYALLDITPKGRDETGPSFNLTDWVHHHDSYGYGGSTGQYRSNQDSHICCGSEEHHS